MTNEELTTALRHLYEAQACLERAVTALSPAHPSEPQDGCTCNGRFDWRLGRTVVNPLCPTHGDARDTGVVQRPGTRP